MKKLYTIGYEGADVSDFVRTLSHVGVEALVDIRELPLSRRAGFSKKSLADQVQENGIEYIHLKGLGDPKPGRIAAREGRYGDFKRIFNTHMRSEVAKADLEVCLEIANQKVACLLCFERDHSKCHRCIVADRMAKVGGYKLVHLGVNPLVAQPKMALSGVMHGIGKLELGSN